jgi:MFS family permease
MIQSASSEYKLVEMLITEKYFAENDYFFASGIWSASFYLGNFVGPTAAGFMVEAYGFRSTSVVFFALYCVMVLVDASELLFRVGAGRRHGYERL